MWTEALGAGDGETLGDLQQSWNKVHGLHMALREPKSPFHIQDT